jgi:pSer/pThr/pTyr-binding forkhead associated (FHA) protein
VIAADRYRREQPPQPHAEAETPPAEIHCLEIIEGELPETTIVVDSSSVKLGRTAPAGIVVPHRSVSREHCIVGLANDELLVTDLNSTNGTYIDGERISRATILPVGSVLGVGQISLRHAIRSDDETGDREPQPKRVAATS